MSWLEFIAAMTKALAWPLAVFGVVFLFRRQLRALFGQGLKRFRVGWFEAEFNERLQVAEESVETAVRAGTPRGTAGVGPYTERFTPVLDEDPEAAIRASWAMFENEMRPKLLQLLNKKEMPSRSFARLLDAAKEESLLPRRFVSALRLVWELRETATHMSEPLSRDSAAKYLELLDTLDVEWRRMQQPPEQPHS